jgi:hypothetical protein
VSEPARPRSATPGVTLRATGRPAIGDRSAWAASGSITAQQPSGKDGASFMHGQGRCAVANLEPWAAALVEAHSNRADGQRGVDRRWARTHHSIQSAKLRPMCPVAASPSGAPLTRKKQSNRDDAHADTTPSAPGQSTAALEAAAGSLRIHHRGPGRPGGLGHPAAPARTATPGTRGCAAHRHN